MTAIKDIEGIGDVFTKKLQGIGINSVEALLEKGATEKGREDVAKQSGIDKHKILEWVNRADLYRIKGIGSEYSDLLEAAVLIQLLNSPNEEPITLQKKWLK